MVSVGGLEGYVGGGCGSLNGSGVRRSCKIIVFNRSQLKLGATSTAQCLKDGVLEQYIPSAIANAHAIASCVALPPWGLLRFAYSSAPS